MEFVEAAKDFGFGSQRGKRCNDFFTDRLVHLHTTKMLLIFILLATLKQFFDSPINCWVPAELKRYEDYMNRFCWLKGTFYVNQNYEANTLNIEARNESLLHYYRWVYFFLIFQAFLFYLPRVIWHFITQRLLDYDLFNLVDAACQHESSHHTGKEDVANILTYIQKMVRNDFAQISKTKREFEHIDRLIKHQDSKNKNKNDRSYELYEFRNLRVSVGRSLLTYTYVAVKCLYLFIACWQVHMMNVFLSSKKHAFYGYEILSNILQGQADLGYRSDSKVFPRITICDVTTTEVGAHHTYTVQCVLSFNLFNERIYAFLWFWIFCVLIPFQLIDLLGWLKRIVLGSWHRHQWVKARVSVFNEIRTPRDKFLLKLFTELYLGQDGVFVLRLVETNSNAVVIADAFNQMWLQFKEEHS